MPRVNQEEGFSRMNGVEERSFHIYVPLVCLDENAPTEKISRAL